MRPLRRPLYRGIIAFPVLIALAAVLPSRGWSASDAQPPQAAKKANAAKHKGAAKSARPARKPGAARQPAAKPKPAPKSKPAQKAPNAAVRKPRPQSPPRPAQAAPVQAAPAQAPSAAPVSPETVSLAAERKSAAIQPLSRREAEARYREASDLHRRGDLPGAFKAYQEAAEGGHGPAQKKLGDLYGTGNEVVERDYETSLRWYSKAREQGIHVPKPFAYPGVRR